MESRGRTAHDRVGESHEADVRPLSEEPSRPDCFDEGLGVEHEPGQRSDRTASIESQRPVDRPFPAARHRLQPVRPVCCLLQLPQVHRARFFEQPAQAVGLNPQLAGSAFHRLGRSCAQPFGSPVVLGEIEPLGGMFDGLVDAAVELRLGDVLR